MIKICLKENEFNPSLLQQSWCNEEKAIEMGYTIVEAPEDCTFEDFENLEFNQAKYNQRKQKELEIENIFSELDELLSWFDEYDNQVKQYERCRRLNIEYDRDINLLDIQAKANAERITEIRNILKGE